MANITLTTKDADFVANFIREQIEDLHRAYNNAIEEGNNRAEGIRQLAEVLLEDGPDEDVKARLDELDKTKENSFIHIKELYEHKLKAMEKVLELMMIGSTQ